MGEGARKIESPVRARLHELVDALMDAVEASRAPVLEESVLPLATAAQRVGWSRDRLRRFCLERGVAVTGRGKLAAVDLRAVREAMAGQKRVRHDAPSRELEDDLRDAFARKG